MLKPHECTNCVLAKISRSFSRPEGDGTLNVSIIGEGCGHDEAIDGLPFRPYAASGSLLEQTFKSLGYRRSQFRLWNLIGCQPPNNALDKTWYEEKAINHCKVHFDKVIPRVDNGGDANRVIFALGNVPLKWLTGASGIGKEKQSISYLQGFVLRSPYGLVVPFFHPAYIRRGATEYTEMFRTTLQRAVDVAQGRFLHPYAATYKQPEFTPYPSLDDAVSFAYRVKDTNGKVPLGVDIETPMSRDKDSGGDGDSEDTEDATEGKEGIDAVLGAKEAAINATSATPILSPRWGSRHDIITTVQFSLGEWEGICFPWDNGGPYSYIAKEILKLKGEVLGWNFYTFDQPRLERNGVRFGAHKITDLMWKWHHYQPDLDRNLQFAASYCGWPFPWKHLYGSKMQWYGCADVAVLHWIENRITKPMEAKRHPQSGVSLMDGYERWVYNTWPRLKAASDIGYNINRVEREKVGVWLKSEKERIYGEVQGVTPISIRNVSPRREVK